MKAWSMAIFLFVFSAAVSVAQEKYIASYAGFAGFQAPLWAAKDFGFMTKYNVNADLVMIPGSARGAQAMLGGSIHFGQIDGTALIAAINQGADLVFVASSLNKFPFSLVTQKNIRQPKDLVGKKIGIVSLGGAHGTADSGPHDRAQSRSFSDERDCDAALVYGEEPRGDQALPTSLR
jgi:ABC-type nitrate/sulfonate/bicarbonate transport system substrate-binding protein